ncbi:periplasmic heavy metal sensor [bacterium]|nr:periplasmic heavy metal sensor [bacterium]
MFKLAAIPMIAGMLLAASAVRMPGGQGFMNPGMLLNPKVSEELDLTRDQQAKIKKIQDDHQEKVLDTKQKIERLGLELKRLFEEDAPQQSKIEAKVREIGALRTALQIERVNLCFEVRKLLTDEQIKKLRDMHPFRGSGEGPHDGQGRFNR